MSASILTPRQKQFLQSLLQLWENRKAPIHYTELAEQLDVSRFSAYDMLRVLEDKGLVVARYRIERGLASAGRSSVFYEPTSAGMEATCSSPPLELSLPKEWKGFQERLLQHLRATDKISHQSLIKELLDQIPGRNAPLLYCSQVIAALLINLNQARQRIAGMNPMDTVKSLISANDLLGLSTLAGVSLGTGFSSLADRSELTRLIEHTRRYQEVLSELGEEGIKALSDFVEDAIETLYQARIGPPEGYQHDMEGYTGGSHD